MNTKKGKGGGPHQGLRDKERALLRPHSATFGPPLPFTAPPHTHTAASSRVATAPSPCCDFLPPAATTPAPAFLLPPPAPCCYCPPHSFYCPSSSGLPYFPWVPLLLLPLLGATAMHALTHTCIHACMHTHTCMHAYTHACTHTHMHAHMHAHTHSRTRTHTCSHTHMHAHKRPGAPGGGGGKGRPLAAITNFRCGRGRAAWCSWGGPAGVQYLKQCPPQPSHAASSLAPLLVPTPAHPALHRAPTARCKWAWIQCRLDPGASGSGSSVSWILTPSG